MINRTLITAALFALGLLSAGCQKTSMSSRGEINTEPLAIDPAMQLRQWDPVTAAYENGSTFNNPTGYAYESKPGQPGYTYYYADAGTFFVNLVTLPYTLIADRGGAESGGVNLPPSYTAVPPLPPSYNDATSQAVPATQPQ